MFAHCIVKDLFSNIRNFIVFIQSNLHVLNDDNAVRSEGVQCTPKIVCNLQKNKCTTQTRLWADSEWMNDGTNNLLQSILQYEYIVFTLHFLCCALNIRAASNRSHELQRIIMTKAIENTHTDDDIILL